MTRVFKVELFWYFYGPNVNLMHYNFSHVCGSQEKYVFLFIMSAWDLFFFNFIY